MEKTKTLAKLRKPQNRGKPQNCVQMQLSCMATNLVMEPAHLTRFNVQAILIIAWTILLEAFFLSVMASIDVKNSALAPLKSSNIMTKKTIFLAVVVMAHAAIVRKGMGPNSTTSNAQSLISI